MSNTPKPQANTLDELMKMIKDYASGFDVGSPEPSEEQISQAIQALITEARNKVADNALTIAEYWLAEDGRPKHLIQDLWDVQDISVLNHIDDEYVNMYKGFNSKQNNLNQKENL